MDNLNKNTLSFHHHLTELFGEYRAIEAAPAEIKKEVFNTLENIQLLGDLVDLFTIKFFSTEMTLLGELKENTELKKEDDHGEE